MSFKQGDHFVEVRQEPTQEFRRFQIVDNYWEDLVERQHCLDLARRQLDAPLLTDKEIQAMFDKKSCGEGPQEYVRFKSNENKFSCLQLFLDL